MTSALASTATNLPPKVCEMTMTERHGSFLLGGLELVKKELEEKDVPLHILHSKSHSQVGQTVYDFVAGVKEDEEGQRQEGREIASVVVCDMNPLRMYREWYEDQAAPLLGDSGIPLYQVDAQ